MKVGVLGYQGSVAEHMAALSRVGARAVSVRYSSELAGVDGMVLPGGESTAIAKLLRDFGLFEPLRERILAGMPVYGTCAGMILLAKKIVGQDAHLGVMDITVRRNAYGTQADSFSVPAVVADIRPEPIPLTFVRAPWIEAAGEGVKVLLKLDGHIVAARQNNILATSFHPELTTDPALYNYFLTFF